jgi:hypothetical protein
MNLEAKAAATVAGGGGLLALLASAQQVALELFGFPLPVLLAGIVGALIAASYLPKISVWRLIVGVLAWAFLAAACSEFLRWAIGAWSGKDLPPSVAVGIAGVTGLVLQFAAPSLPEILRWAAARVQALIERLTDRISGGGPK